jgi:transcriptional regulator with XRE-family HTH domain
VAAHSGEFGRELRRLRLDAGFTLAELAARVFYSKGQLSKIERGLKKPDRELARLCDATLKADGFLIGLLPSPEQGAAAVGASAGEDYNEETWIMQLSPDGASRFQPIGRRQVITAGAASAMSIGLGGFETSSSVDQTDIVDSFHLLFDQYRRLGQTISPDFLLPSLIAQTHTLRELARQAGPRARGDLLRLGSRYAEYVGWLVQETGDERGALWWTRRAVDMAAAGGDPDLAAYALVRRALVCLYRDDGPQTVALARRAQHPSLPPRIRGLAAQREAQGHALVGDYNECMRCLDRARRFLADDSHGGGPVIGTTNLSDPVEMIRGWCLYDLGWPGQAADVLDRQMAQVPAHAARTRARYGIRSARAHAAAGEIDHACQLVDQLLGTITTVSSATIIADLSQLARTLARHPRNPSVRALTPELGVTLNPATG